MFEDRHTWNGVKIILPPINSPRPVSQQVLKRIHNLPKRPHTVAPPLKPLDHLKALRKLRRLQKNVGISKEHPLKTYQI